MFRSGLILKSSARLLTYKAIPSLSWTASSRICLTHNRTQLLWKTPVRSFHAGTPARAFDAEKEIQCREIIESLPPLEDIFQNPDGSKRQPSEDELKKIAYLNSYVKDRELTFMESVFNFPREYADLYNLNSESLESLRSSCQIIIDKIPYEDTSTGEIKWEIVRDGDEVQGWETAAYYGLVPALLFILLVLAFHDDLTIHEWALRELVYRVKEKATGEGDTEVLEEISKFGRPDGDFKLDAYSTHDAVIIERIIKGDYDRMASLKINQTELEKKKLASVSQ